MSIFQNKIKAKALKIHQQSVPSLEYTVKFPPRKKIGVTFRRHNEWGIVKVVPPHSKIIIGSILSAVNGRSVVLTKFDDAIQLAAEALTSGDPFTLTFMAPYKLEGVLKRYEMRRMAKGWKTYFFTLNSGVLQCYVKKGGKLRCEWDLSNEASHQTLLTLAPRNLLNSGELGLMIVKGTEKVILKAEDNIRTQNWGAFLYLAIVIANGGNPDMYAIEARRLRVKAPPKEVQKATAAIIDAGTATKVAEVQHHVVEKADTKAHHSAANAELLQKAAEKATDEEEKTSILEAEKKAEEAVKRDEEIAQKEHQEEERAQKVSRRASQVSSVAGGQSLTDAAQAAAEAALQEEADAAAKKEAAESSMQVIIVDEAEVDAYEEEDEVAEPMPPQPDPIQEGDEQTADEGAPPVEAAEPPPAPAAEEEEEPEAEEEYDGAGPAEVQMPVGITAEDADVEEEVAAAEEVGENEDEQAFNDYVALAGKAEEAAVEEAVEEAEKELAALNVSAEDDVEAFDFDREQEMTDFAEQAAEMAAKKLADTAPDVAPDEGLAAAEVGGSTLGTAGGLTAEEQAAMAAYDAHRIGDGSQTVIGTEKGSRVRPGRHERGRRSVFQRWEDQAKRAISDSSMSSKPADYKPKVLRSKEDKVWMAAF
uniref:PH domain-containing protein n=1 Tax=Rhizochromulina marina TaxID=1034831 RepID=A0A7S2R516_9STRA|mmetsp:Transcript_10732/g.30778  ORF Transcript_10732/g.30778 Transcript_10732/m.30778 type:complete len:648 (+) Transcript_10732:83-2026(+)